MFSKELFIVFFVNLEQFSKCIFCEFVVNVAHDLVELTVAEVYFGVLVVERAVDVLVHFGFANDPLDVRVSRVSDHAGFDAETVRVVRDGYVAHQVFVVDVRVGVHV